MKFSTTMYLIITCFAAIIALLQSSQLTLSHIISISALLCMIIFVSIKFINSEDEKGLP